jgi:hypothetical protein
MKRPVLLQDERICLLKAKLWRRVAALYRKGAESGDQRDVDRAIHAECLAQGVATTLDFARVEAALAEAR